MHTYKDLIRRRILKNFRFLGGNKQGLAARQLATYLLGTLRASACLCWWIGSRRRFVGRALPRDQNLLTPGRFQVDALAAQLNYVLPAYPDSQINNRFSPCSRFHKDRCPARAAGGVDAIAPLHGCTASAREQKKTRSQPTELRNVSILVPREQYLIGSPEQR